MHTTDTLFHFNNDLLCFDFPTNSSKLTNEYLIYYFSQKTARCPTLFSLLKYYEPTLESELKQQQLPRQLMFIPVVCSAFDPNAENGLGGTGYWHLNYPQAVKYGLTVNEYIDERKDFNKSTRAAAAYLHDLQQQFDDWELTLAAYSSGVVNVKKLMKRHHTNSYKDIATYLPEETKDFVQAFVAMIFIHSYDRYGAVQLQPVLEADTVKTDRKLHVKAVRDVIGTKENDLQFLNPVLVGNWLPAGYEVLLPAGDGAKFLTMKDSIYDYQDSVLLKPEPEEPEIVIPKDGETMTYIVKSGDVLGLIAQRFNVKVSQLQAWNNLDGTRINVGQKLMIYGKPQKKPFISNTKPKDEEPEETTKPELKFSSDKYTTYTVKSGDNLWLIAKKYPGISPDNIMDFNGIDADLTVGQVLKIPKQ
ncbi:MAG: LysM peptidoglycan-binding domain-containing protein [Flavobacteriales bacterium]|nr:LysM peptidoglycan-binding domain-containing protein [Flavobacteriales bacterium]